MEYRKISDEPLRAEIMRSDARSREREAFIAEIEVKRQQRLGELTEPQHKELADAAANKAAAQEGTARSLRAVADARAKATGLVPTDVLTIHLDVLDGWVEALEREHVAKTTELELVSGRGQEAKAARSRLRDEVLVIESAHALAVEMLDDVNAELGEDYPEEPEPDQPD